jgi:pimeloyl-ACP methyl ester carboxylesterase
MGPAVIMSAWHRRTFEHDGLRFSYLDTGGTGPLLVLLHAHWMGASDFEDVVPALAEGWRVVGLDQRGHGETQHGGTHSVDAYVGDVDALLAAIVHAGPFVLLGHSFGGMVANHYAAVRPDRVRALIMEDIDVAREDHDDFISPWAGVFPTRDALEERIGARLAPYLRKSMKRVADGWTLTFEPREVLESSKALNGDYWHVWLGHTCPALVIRGAHSKPVDGNVLAEMARRRPDTELATIDAGHSVHIDAPEAFVAAVRAFLAKLP